MHGASLDVVLLVAAGVVLVAALAVRVATRVGVPSLLAYLALGLALHAAGGIHVDDLRLAQDLALGALVVILAEGGLTTRWHRMRPALPFAVALALAGTAISVLVVALVAAAVLHLDARLAVLLGAALAPTDAAAIFSTLRRLGIRPYVAAALEAESGLNDAPVVVVVLELSRHLHTGSGVETTLRVASQLGLQLSVGAVVGAALGWGGVQFLRRSALGAAGLYPIATVALTVVSYGAAAALHGSGFLAVYLSAVYLGNAALPHRRAVLGFIEGLAWLAQIGLFILLGLLVAPSELGNAVGAAVVIGGVLLVVARPLSVAACAVPWRLPWREQAIVSWAGLRGAVPIVLATLPVTAAVPGSRRLLAVVFVVVVLYTLVQGPTLAPLARRLGILSRAELEDLAVESAPLEEMGADLLQLTVTPGSRLHGVEVSELRLPAGASVTLVVRDGAGFVPAPDTRLRHGDDLLVVATAASRDAAERRIRAVHRAGRLARWRGEAGVE